MACRIAYASQADAARRRLPAQRRTALDKAMKSTIGANPYGHGSVEAKPGERDYEFIAADGPRDLPRRR